MDLASMKTENERSRRRSFYESKSSQHRPKWMVMGSIPLLSEAIRRNVASLRFSTLFWVVFMLVILQGHCERHSGVCSVDECSTRYQKATRKIDRNQEKNPSLDLTAERYLKVKRLHRCLHNIRRVCRGNLLYHSIKHINDRDQRKFNCTRKPTIAPPSDMPHLSEFVKTNTTSATMTTTSRGPRDGDVCPYTGSSPHKHCGMFGDPHLRTFDDVFNTCKVEGTWPLIDNDHMIVMVTNVPVKEGSSATVTTQITVLIRGAGECAGQRHYIATSEQLPGAFTDGSSKAGSVEVVEVEPGKQVEIRVNFIGATVIIRQVARYLTFAIRIPDEYILGVSFRTQLCVQGCPAEHQLSPIQTHDSLDSKTSLDSDQQLHLAPSTPSHPRQVRQPLRDAQLETSSLESPQYFTEKEARKKCRQILLDLPGEEEESEEKSVEETESREVPDGAKSSFHSLASLPSKAFSSLRPSSHSDASRSKHHRMAAARRPPSESLHSSSRSHRSSKSRRSRSRSRSKRSSRSFKDEEQCPTNKDSSEDSNFYFESCVFDLITTGDIDFSLAAKAALDDVKRTHVMGGDAPGTSLEVIRLWEPVEHRPKCPNPKTTDNGRGAAPSHRLSHLTLLLCVIFSCLYVNAGLLSSVFSTVKSVKRNETYCFERHERANIKTNLISSEAS